jgi:hypothetical protein
MAAHVNLTIETPDVPIASLRDSIDRTDKFRVLRAIVTLVQAIGMGIKRGYVRVCIASATASQTIGCDQSDAVDGTDTVTIAGTTLEVEAAPADQDEFLKGDTDIEFAANLAAAINAHTTLQKIVRAESDGVDTVTVYSKYPGPIGNLIALTEAGDGFTLGGAVLAGGASDEHDGYQFGYDP